MSPIFWGNIDTSLEIGLWLACSLAIQLTTLQAASHSRYHVHQETLEGANGTLKCDKIYIVILRGHMSWLPRSINFTTVTHHMVHISTYMSHGTYKYMYMIQNKCWALRHSCAHVESAKHFDQEGLRQLQCTKCVWEVVLFIYSHKYPEAKRQLLPWKQVSLPWKLA